MICVGQVWYLIVSIPDLCNLITFIIRRELPKAQPKVVLWREAENRTCDPWFTRHSAYPLHQGGFSIWAYTWVSEKFGHSNAKTQKTGH